MKVFLHTPQNGVLVSGGYAKKPYLLPTILHMPTDITPVVLELADSDGPFGAREMAEMLLIPFASAVACAIHDATGVWLKLAANDTGACA